MSSLEVTSLKLERFFPNLKISDVMSGQAQSNRPDPYIFCDDMHAEWKDGQQTELYNALYTIVGRLLYLRFG